MSFLRATVSTRLSRFFSHEIAEDSDDQNLTIARAANPSITSDTRTVGCTGESSALSFPFGVDCVGRLEVVDYRADQVLLSTVQ